MNLDEIIEAGKRATPRPWGPDPSSDDETIAICTAADDKHICILQRRFDPDEEDANLKGDPAEERRREDDAEYIWLAANHADTLAAKLKRIGQILDGSKVSAELPFGSRDDGRSSQVVFRLGETEASELLTLMADKEPR